MFGAVKHTRQLWSSINYGTNSLITFGRCSLPDWVKTWVRKITFCSRLIRIGGAKLHPHSPSPSNAQFQTGRLAGRQQGRRTVKHKGRKACRYWKRPIFVFIFHQVSIFFKNVHFSIDLRPIVKAFCRNKLKCWPLWVRRLAQFLSKKYCQVRLGWVGLGWVGLGWVGLGWEGLG